ncbi:DUF6438 domain-containing protein [Sphingomicrobium astaxanthinifaciens]|uniref:DUF6438 domain-containing protein n=1 Tax=Sphingomicrobium astaxanthinifaciens TaxID=1227949 RepID=UPI001FCADB55|nr:DUF6438 domain-containing protein [Sphingomicrobium astaxanthinifaciens]MCJ7422009.1 DUF6438 domain-containing protein [Sphingomicrobium astaxanthinifaciens]
MMGLALAGCASLQKRPEPLAITYETTPCLGSCAVYRLGVNADGIAVWEGGEHVKLVGQRMFVVSPAEFERFRAALEPYRPEGVRSLATPGECNDRWTSDAPGVIVSWTEDKQTDRLVINYGCDLEMNRAMFQALADAPDVLPLDIYLDR